MTSIGTGYDLYTSVFSPDGRVFQVDYASKAVEATGTVLALRGRDGVVFAAEKIITSKLVDTASRAKRRLFSVAPHAGLAVAGLLADGHSLVDTAITEASNYKDEYGLPIPLKMLADRVAMLMHAYTLYSAIRPFGCTVMLASCTKEEGPKLYCVEPNGVSYGYFGCAAGKAKQAAKTEIEKLELKNMSTAQLVDEAARIIYAVHDEVKDKMFELELSWVGECTQGRHELVPKEVAAEAERKAKAALEEDDSDDSDDDEDMA